MADRLLITGGAGFIGSHLADELLAEGYQVRVLDNLTEQVHGPGRRRPAYLAGDVELVVGDVGDPAAVQAALRGVDGVFHLAARVGVGQSMYAIDDYVRTNDLGTATLLQALSKRPVGALVVASSMSIYGEGLYRTAAGEPVGDARRTRTQLERAAWEPRRNGEALLPVPTPETKQPDLASVYALSKYAQERLCLLIGETYGIRTVALRFFNTYGSRQALSNPYTGVLAIFAARLLNGNRPLVFEDGEQQRDFVHVKDVARACRLALESADAAGQAINVGSGRSATVREIAAALGEAVGRPDLAPEITGRCRLGDIRHCFADVSLARRVLGYEPRWPLAQGLGELIAWLDGQPAVDRVDAARGELASRGLTL